MSTNETSHQFPHDFVWGVATASVQIEGATEEGGKGESIWDRFASRPGKVVNGDTPAVACDHYHRYERDAALMQQLGLRHHRFSIAWPRVYPQGTGVVNAAGLDFYDRLIDALLACGITPWVTLYHWDLPQALEDRGGWLERSTAEAFRGYVETVVRRLSDRVRHWFTLNEIPSFIGMGYGAGNHAPGRQETRRSVNAAYHHALLAHGHAVSTVREWGGKDARVGLVHNPASALPVVETPEHVAAARSEYGRRNEHLMAPLFLGHYPRRFLEQAGDDGPRVADEDMTLIAQPTDFLGLNLYTGRFVREGREGRPEPLTFPRQYPKGDLPWLNVTPQVLYWAIRHAKDLYGVNTFYITENGSAFADEVTPEGEILDLDRREFLRNYLISLHRGVMEGYDVRGYFLWSAMDNFEWTEGYAKRFGIIHVDYQTQRRTPKLSAHWYSQVIRQNRVV